MKLNKITAGILVVGFLIVTFPGYAAGSTYTLTLDNAKKLALENSRTMRDALLGLDYADITEGQQKNNYLSARDARREASAANKNASLIDSALRSEKQAESSKEQAEDNYAYTKDMILAAEKKVEYAMEQRYLQALQLEDSIKLQEKSYQLLKDQLDVLRIKKELGLSTHTEITAKAVETDNALKTLNYTKEQYRTTIMVINDMIGRDSDESLQLSKINVQVKPSVNTFGVIQSATDKSAVIAKEERAISRYADDRGNLTSKSDEYDLLVISEERSKIAIENEKMNIKTAVNDAVNNLNEKKKAYELARVSLDNSRTILEQNKAKYDLGLISKLELTAAQIQMEKALNEYEAAGYNYYLAYRKIEIASDGVIVQ